MGRRLSDNATGTATGCPCTTARRRGRVMRRCRLLLSFAAAATAASVNLDGGYPSSSLRRSGKWAASSLRCLRDRSVVRSHDSHRGMRHFVFRRPFARAHPNRVTSWRTPTSAIQYHMSSSPPAPERETEPSPSLARRSLTLQNIARHEVEPAHDVVDDQDTRGACFLGVDRLGLKGHVPRCMRTIFPVTFPSIVPPHASAEWACT